MSGSIDHIEKQAMEGRMRLECYEQIMECGIRKGELVICYPSRH